MDISHIITKRPKERQRDGDNDRGEQLPQPLLELDSPLPTPRRSCASTDNPRCRRDASTLRVRTQVPFSWESSPGVPKSRAVDVLPKNKAAPETTMPPPKPPPGRCTSSKNWRYGNASDRDTYASSFFSVDALDNRTIPSSSSSPDQRAIGSGSFDRVTSKRFEDIFLGRASSFVKDDRYHSRHALSDASSSGRSSHHPKQWLRRHDSTDDDVEPPNTDPAVQVHVVPRIKVRPRVDQMSPRACGLMVFFPWSAKPAVCGGFRSPSSLSQRATPRSSGASDHPIPSRSHSRRSTTTLRDALQEENKTDDDGIGQAVGLPRREKRSREEWQGRGWGVSSLLGTSKKYCTDARKALSKLSIGLGADSSGSPRVGRERNDAKAAGCPNNAGHGYEADEDQD